MTDLEDYTIELSTGKRLPTLRERAIQYLESAEEARQRAEDSILDSLRQEAYEFLVYKLEVPAGTASVGLADAAAVRKTNEKHEGHPSEPVKGLALVVKVDGDALRFSFERVKAFSLGASDNKEFASETIYDDVLVCEWRSPSHSYYRITDLATLGAMIAEHVR